MKALVTGGTGFVGPRLLRLLNKPTVLTRNPERAAKKIGHLAKEVYAQLTEDFICEYDEVGSIGKRYARMDEI